MSSVFCVSGGRGQMVQMDSSASGYVGSQVELRCQFINSNPPVKISQVTWQKFLNGTKQNVAIANPALGVSVLPPFKERVRFKNPSVRQRSSSLEDTTITFSNLRLSDEAAYICEYTTFPAGNRESMANLTVYARPMVQMSLSTPSIVAGSPSGKMTVATCVSANGKPPSVITWDTDLNGEAITLETRNSDGTITVRSDYMLVPSRQTNQQTLTCVSTYNNEKFSDSVTLNIQYEPDVIIEGFDGNWYLNRENVRLTCLADANPPISLYQWRYLNGSMSSKVELRDDVLHFKGPVTYDMAGTYVCDATNSIGTGSASVEVTVTEFPSFPQEVMQELQRVGTAVSGVVVCGTVLVAAITLLVVFYYHRQHTFKGNYSTKKPIPGNSYSKNSSLNPQIPVTQILTACPENVDDEETTERYGGLSGLTQSGQDFHSQTDSLEKVVYGTGDEKQNWMYGESNYIFEGCSEVEVSVDIVSQTDGCIISREEWYV
ncbi:nectin 1a [Chanos chanos]|uniref:Nectin 1a n=1 Tax=Chanos chanos TaxID=29144 RepID=A0A6J2W0B8_CHACN|nr:nectin-1-like [Chanos chanos]